MTPASSSSDPLQQATDEIAAFVRAHRDGVVSLETGPCTGHGLMRTYFFILMLDDARFLAFQKERAAA